MAGFWRVLGVVGATMVATAIWLMYDVMSVLGFEAGSRGQHAMLTPLVIVLTSFAAIALFKSAAPRISFGSMVWALGTAILAGASVWLVIAASDNAGGGEVLRPGLFLAGGLFFIAGGIEHIRRSSHKLKYFAYMFAVPLALCGAGAVLSQQLFPPPGQEALLTLPLQTHDAT